MTSTSIFEFLLYILVAILALEVVARRLALPPAVALIAGGVVMAVLPGVPDFAIEPELVLVLFLPPLLMEGGYFTSWHDFRRHIGGILSLAVGAVLFTTLAVGLAAHWAMPSLPWAACFALGAIVSPPDAVAARAVLERVELPRRLLVELQGESLLNDATGLTLLQFAIVAAMTHHFSAGAALGKFFILAAGGGIVGVTIAWGWLKTLPLLKDSSLTILSSFLVSWAAYILGEGLRVSGVLAVVAAGMVVGWRQHEAFPASLRVRITSFWQVMVFLLEAFVFILIGLTLREITRHIGSPSEALALYGKPVLVVIATVIAARFVWVYGAGLAYSGLARLLKRRAVPFSWRSAFAISWAGMRGVVTIAIALALPDAMPGRGFIIITAFAVVFVTVIVQGTSLGRVIGLLRLRKTEGGTLSRREALARVIRAQHAAIETLAYDESGTLVHPRLLEQFSHRVRASQNYVDNREALAGARQAHYETLLATIEAGRQELLALHRAGRVEDELMHNLEQQLDLQELAADLERSAP
ncbi:Na+/H+ antiporter [Acidomonas methanolica]|uniref:Na+/H+ antiporter n=1 Tax=Acidomonas methanolica NBRC 104435 TaxID=1231351 RepID=A0A023D549_ACIMT|nr:Na+/H+ antiporter [Acidomonas methanolica]MBU2653744.1 Na+/H+ antiporter [Acidomonas methanolica]TCS31697.1 sodium/proton antiporter (CPA1 family) [Acidomonas methanolica]GAJ28910.1 Na+/H+ antiporter [Acidomonas methanolica NBRC 104435]GBQ55094.1 Na+/H+ antiporter [Acidomonas methanolica]GEK98114.1 Na+/H+ antiporter [Acidomonas methanolica NBRC 104435]